MKIICPQKQQQPVSGIIKKMGSQFQTGNIDKGKQLMFHQVSPAYFK
jgi:hypothetical protein